MKLVAQLTCPVCKRKFAPIVAWQECDTERCGNTLRQRRFREKKRCGGGDNGGGGGRRRRLPFPKLVKPPKSVPLPEPTLFDDGGGILASVGGAALYHGDSPDSPITDLNGYYVNHSIPKTSTISSNVALSEVNMYRNKTTCTAAAVSKVMKLGKQASQRASILGRLAAPPAMRRDHLDPINGYLMPRTAREESVTAQLHLIFAQIVIVQAFQILSQLFGVHPVVHAGGLLRTLQHHFIHENRAIDAQGQRQRVRGA
jgi:hypothetical protein